jgi:hypothetical protein
MNPSLDNTAVDHIVYAGEMMHITDAVSIMQCSGMSDQQVLDWLERRLKIGKFAGHTVTRTYYFETIGSLEMIAGV